MPKNPTLADNQDPIINRADNAKKIQPTHFSPLVNESEPKAIGKVSSSFKTLPQAINTSTSSIQSQLKTENDTSSGMQLPKVVAGVNTNKILSVTPVIQSMPTIQSASDSALTSVTSGDIEKIIKSGDNTIIVKTDKDVYVNTYEQITEQKYITAGGSGGTPGGNNEQVQFNLSGTFAGSSGLTYNSGTNTLTADNLTVNGTTLLGAMSNVSITGGTSGQVLCTNGSGVLNWATVSGGGSPGGCNTQIQFNDGGAFGGDSGLTYNKSTDTVGLTNIANSTTSINITVGTPVTNSWIATYGDLSIGLRDDYSSAVSYDSAGNIYTVGADGDAGVPFLVKYDSLGNVIWQINFTEVNNYYKTGDAVEVDNNDDVYVGLSFDDTARNASLIKINSTGSSILWQRDITGGSNVAILDIVVDTLNNVYALATDMDGDTKAVLLKYNSVGTLLWQRSLSKLGSNCYPGGMSIDSDDNVYINTQDSSGTYSEPVIVKYNTNGILQWQTQLVTGVLDSVYSNNIAVDSSGNIYVAVNSFTDIMTTSLIKLNSLSVIQWQKNVDIPNEIGEFTVGLAVDSTGDIYNLIWRNNLYIQKYNSSGTLLWSNSLSNTYAYYYWSAQNLALYGNNFTISGYSYPGLGYAEALTATLPKSGAGYGTWDTFVYAPFNITPTTTSFTTTAGSLDDNTGTLIDSAGTFSIIAGTGSNNTTTITGLNNWSFDITGSLSTPNYTLPAVDGYCNTVLTTNGAGCLTWKNPIKLNSNGSFFATSQCINNNTSYNAIAVGYAALGNSTGDSNIGIGSFSLQCNTAGECNIAVGAQSLNFNTVGKTNVAIGFNALLCNTSGNNNIGIGIYSGYTVNCALSNNNISLGCYSGGGGTKNISIGDGAGSWYDSNENNIAIGVCNSTFICNNQNNIALGGSAMKASTSSCNNIAIGIGSFAYGSGTQNIALGIDSLGCLCGGANNIGIGWSSGKCLTNACGNIFIGSFAGMNVGNGNCNVIIGNSSFGSSCLQATVLIGTGFCQRVKVDNTGLYINGSCWCSGGGGGASPATPTSLGTVYASTNSSTFNSYIGYCAGSEVVSPGTCNIAIGKFSQRFNYLGYSNISLGLCALYCNQNTYSNIAIGQFAMAACNFGDGNIALGSEALTSNTAGINNIAMGCSSLGYNTCGKENIAFGWRTLSANLSGCFNIAVGKNALTYNTGGNDNISQGYYGLYSNTSGNNNISLGRYSSLSNKTGSDNIVIGRCSLFCNISGSDNIAIGCKSLVLSNNTGSNIGIGSGAGTSITTGVNNTIIGSLAGSAGLVCTVLIGAGTCERIKVDNSGLYINNSLFPNSLYDSFTNLTGSTGVVVHDFSLGPVFRHTSISNNFTVNVTNLNLGSGSVTNISLLLVQGATPYMSTALQIGGVGQTINWLNSTPPSGTANKIDIVNFSILNDSGTYTVIGQSATFG